MSIQKILNKYTESPVLIGIFVVFYAIVFLFSLIKLPAISPAADYTFAIILKLVLLFISAVFLSLAIGAGYLSLKNKGSLKSSLKYLKFSFGNFLFLLIFTVINLIFLVFANYLGRFFVNYFSDITSAYMQAAVYYLGFLLVSVFFLFSFFYFTINKQNILKSILSSIKSVRGHYFKILSIPIFYLIVSIAISFIPIPIAKEAIYFLVVYPIFSLILIVLFENVSTK